MGWEAYLTKHRFAATLLCSVDISQGEAGLVVCLVVKPGAGSLLESRGGQAGRQTSGQATLQMTHEPPWTAVITLPEALASVD